VNGAAHPERPAVIARFERELTAEGIRDKIAASKKKGMRLGGPPPLGYDIQGKKLFVNEAEAETVRSLFDLYLPRSTVRAHRDEADRRGILTKHQPQTKYRGGKPFSGAISIPCSQTRCTSARSGHKKAA